MQLADLKAALLVIDPNLTKYKGTTGAYTTWATGEPSEKLMSDDRAEDQVQRVYIDRYTKADNDSIFGLINKKLDESFVPFEYVHDYEQDTGYHHHSFSCYVGQPEEMED